MKKVICSLALLAPSVGLGGCATVLHGTSQPVEFRSQPPEAEIELATGLKCETPCKYSLKRGKDARVTFTKEGFNPATVYIQSRTGGGVFGNILAGGVIGGVVDASNGAANHLYPDPVYVKLSPIGSDDPALLLDEKGEVISTVDAYNAKVAADVQHGLEEQGIYPMGSTSQ